MARGQLTRKADGRWGVGARKGGGETVSGTIVTFRRRGTIADADVQIDGGGVETLSFDLLDLKAGSRIRFMRNFDGTRPQGVRAVNVKVLS